VDPTARALAARLERLESALAGGGGTTRAAGPDGGASAAAEPTAPAGRAPRAEQAAGGEQGAASAQAAGGASAAAEPVAAAGQTATAVADEPTLDAIRALWPAVLDALRADKGALAASLSDAQPVELRGKQLVVAFDEDDGFNRRMADHPGDRGAVEEALRHLAGADLKVAYELRDLGNGEHEVAAPSEDELVNRFKVEFDAEEIVPDDDPQPEEP
jgi:DNA polymerase-3 subunit gamma/tau